MAEAGQSCDEPLHREEGGRPHQVVAGMAEAGQSCDEPLHREEGGRPHQDVLAET
jgi:hypothetical protein